MKSGDKPVRVAFGFFFAVLFAGGAAVGVKFWRQKQQKPPVLSTEQACAKASELTKLYYSGVGAEIREWVKAQGPAATELVFGCLDNRTDPHSKARIAALEAVLVLRSEEWKETLKKLARTQFHSGPELERYLKEAESF